MARILLFLTVCVLAFGGCEEAKQEAEPPPPPPAGPTPEEIAAEIRPVLDPFKQLIAEEETTFLTEQVEKQVIDALQAAREKHQGTEKGREAIRIITHEIRDLIKQAREQQRWRLILGCIAAHEVLDPESENTRILKDRAELYQTRPLVEVEGFFDDEEGEAGDMYAFLKVTLRPSRKIRHVQVRKGDEFLGLRFVDFVGKKRGVKLEYLAIPGLVWEVLMERHEGYLKEKQAGRTP